MSGHTAKEQHYVWLQEQRDKCQEDILVHKELLSKAEESFSYFATALKALEDIDQNLGKGQEMQQDQTLDQTESIRNYWESISRFNNDNNAADAEKVHDLPDDRMESTQSEYERAPSEMIREEFKGLHLIEVARRILKKNAGRRMSNNDITRIVYATQTQEDFARCRSSIAVVLRSEGQKGGWCQIGRGYYEWQKGEEDSEEIWGMPRAEPFNSQTQGNLEEDEAVNV